MPTLPKKDMQVSRLALSARPVRPANPGGAARPPRDRHKRLGAMLLESNLLTPEQLEQGLTYQKEHGGFLGRALIDLDMIAQETLIHFLVKQCNIPHLNLTEYQILRDVMEMLPLEFCQARQVIAIDRLGSMLTVAMVDPFDIETLEIIRTKFPTLRIKPMLCNWQHLAQVLERRAAKAAPITDELGLVSEALEPEESDGQLGWDLILDLSGDAVEAAVPESIGDPAATETVDSISATTVEAATPLPPSKETQERLPQSVTIPSLNDTIRDVFEENDGAAWIDAFFGDTGDDNSAQETALPRETVAPAGDASKEAPDVSGAREAGVAAVAEADVAALAEEAFPNAPIAGTSLASVVRDTIREAVGHVAQAIRDRGAEDMPPSAQELSGSLRGAVYSAIKGLGERVSSEDALDEVGEDFPEIQAATQQALREAETLVVSEARLQELEAAYRRKQIPFLPRYDSVHSFGNPEQGCLRQEHDDIVLTALESERPLQEYRFDDYFVDKANAFTFSLCRAVAEKPGQDYNPFFLYGSVGVGKTHLINAIGNFIQSRDEVSRVGYVSAIFFASRLGDAIKDGALKAFRDNYCHWDVLILDDMQFLAGRIDAQEEFFHIFNALYQAGRQIIIAGDQAPDRLGLLEERLVSRFSGGIVAHLRPPNYETRLAIVRHHVRLRGAQVPDDVIAFLSQHVTNDVRKLTGSLRKVLAFADLVGQDITMDMARDILGHLDPPRAEAV